MTATGEIRGHHRAKTAGIAIATVLTVALTSAATAQVYRAEILTNPTVIRVEGEAPNAETVMLLTGLAAIERDMMLGMLFLQDGLTSTVGSHFTHPRKETWPGIKDGLAAAGIADFEALLTTLETETDQAAVTAAYMEVNSAVLQAQSALHATEHDLVLAIVEGVRAAHDRFNAAGPTEVVNYQDGWAGLMIERGKVDLLMQSTDPALAKAAGEMGMALDNVILSMPDPAINAPVEFDAAPIAALLAQLEALASTI
jgi:hypothetical protein